MTGRHDLSATLPWMRQGTDRMFALVDKLTDDELREPSRLPDWTRAHVVAHLARNAEALTRLASWARTGVETPMYSSREQRASDIERTAAQPGEVLRAELVSAASTLDGSLAELAEWHSEVRSALGRPMPAAEIPWMRIREVWLHAVDLGVTATMHDVPAGVVDLLLDNVTGDLTAKPDCPSVLLVASDRDRTWRLGSGTSTVEAPAADLAGWLTGRISVPDRPAVPAWL